MNVADNEMQTNALIQFDGRVSLFRAIITDVSCSLFLHRFPFDQQVCYVMLASWSYSGAEIMLQVVEDGQNTTSGNVSQTSLRHYIPNMEWKLTDFRYRINMKYYSCCESPYPDISYFFAIKRNPSYYLFTLIVPSAFITIVTVVGFFTPHSSTGENTEKVSLGVTALLSLAIILMMVSDSLPATSNTVPLLGQYYVGLIMIMFAATYCTTWTLGVQMQGNAGKAIPRRVRNWILGCRHNRLVTDKLTTLKRLFASELLQFQQGFLGTDGNGQAAQVTPAKHTRALNGSIDNAAAIPLIDSDENIHADTHICTSTLHADNKAVNGLLAEVLTSVKAIRQDLLAEEHLKTIRNEWQMLARMIEKILMLFFTTFTILFALFMLYDNQDDPIITDEIMNLRTMA
uniref:Neur_chan_LBD domain-containing protein n=1 Tax=Panagrellus redivivus TaxID=6233 RepID=A0A7E4VAS9_PANRE